MRRSYIYIWVSGTQSLTRSLCIPFPIITPNRLKRSFFNATDSPLLRKTVSPYNKQARWALWRFQIHGKAEKSFGILSENGDSITTLKDIRIGLHAGLILNTFLLLDIYTSIFVNRDPCRRNSNHIPNSRLKWLGFATKYLA